MAIAAAACFACICVVLAAPFFDGRASGIESSNGDFRVGIGQATFVMGDACTNAKLQGMTGTCTVIWPDQWGRALCFLADDSVRDSNAVSVGLYPTFYDVAGAVLHADYDYGGSLSCVDGDLHIPSVPPGAVRVAIGADVGKVNVVWWGFDA